ncbi:glutaredoxin family protein [Desulfomarina sp.]
MAENRAIKLYALTTCSHCRAIKKMFETEGISFEYVDVDLLRGKERREMIEEIRKYNRRCSFPTLRVDDKVIVGYREKEIREALAV